MISKLNQLYFFVFSTVILSFFIISGDASLSKTIEQYVKFIKGAADFTQESVENYFHSVRDYKPKNKEEYDFIIIGAGASGSTLAARLSEDKNTSVLLIEKGGHEALVMDVPLLAFFLQVNPLWTWGYKTEPSNKYCLAMRNHQCSLPLGKVLGGSSSINWMLATRGQARDYNEWASITGDDSWSYKTMLKYFKKLETFDVTLTEFDDQLHNFDGPIRLANIQYHTSLASAFVQAGVELGLPPIDYNGHKQNGFSYVQSNQNIKNERLSTNRAYLYPARHRPNLKTSLNSHVDKILINKETKAAYGVQFTRHGLLGVPRKIQVTARKEVILSAGAVNSPQLLMLSGIGPTQHLKKMKIKVLQDAPVGENLMDHVNYAGLTFLINESVSIELEKLLLPPIPDYFYNRTGPGTILSGLEAVAYVNTADTTADNKDPDIELLFSSTHIGSNYLLHLPFRIQEKHWLKYFSHNMGKPGWFIWPMLLRPKSRGKVLLSSKNPSKSPKIYPNYYSDPKDVRTAIKGIKMAIKVSDTDAMQKYHSTLYDRPVPGCEDFENGSDEYWECALRTYTIPGYHFSGTCKMGTEEDVTAVVNSEGQVKGIKQLRVADASIMPVIPRAHLHIPVIALAENIADKIKRNWGLV